VHLKNFAKLINYSTVKITFNSWLIKNKKHGSIYGNLSLKFFAGTIAAIFGFKFQYLVLSL